MSVRKILIQTKVEEDVHARVAAIAMKDKRSVSNQLAKMIDDWFEYESYKAEAIADMRRTAAEQVAA